MQAGERNVCVSACRRTTAQQIVRQGLIDVFEQLAVLVASSPAVVALVQQFAVVVKVGKQEHGACLQS